MALRAREFAAILALASIAALLALASRPGLPGAEASACGQLGGSNPGKLSAGEARDAVLCLINNERQDHGLTGLDRNRKLQKAAQRHNDRMHGTGCFSHECPGEPDLEARLDQVGYLGSGLRKWAYGENVAWGMEGHGSPKAIVSAWMESSGHRANILSPMFKEIGIGFAAGTPSSKRDPGGIYTTDFGLAVG